MSTLPGQNEVYVNGFPEQSNHDIHPDGERFVMIKPIEEESARLVVVLSWLEASRSGARAP